MAARRRPGGEPNVLDQQLLRVCFLPADEAAAIWDRELAGRLSIDELPTASHALLPLLHRRLVEIDRRPPEMGRLHGIRRRLWVQNELRLRSVGVAVGALADAGVHVALLGGLAVLAGHLRRADLRPIHDADLLVGAADAVVARDVLAARGWSTETPWRGGMQFDICGVRCTDDGGQSVSVRWSTSPPYDDAVSHAVPATLGDASFAVVCDADLVLHVVVDGPRERWASDALAVFADGAPSWDRLVASGSRRGGRAVAEGLMQLDHIVPLVVPPDAMASLAAAPAPGLLARLPRGIARRVGGRTGGR